MLLPSAIVCLSYITTVYSRSAPAVPPNPNSGYIIPIGYELTHSEPPPAYPDRTNADAQVTIGFGSRTLDSIVDIEGYGVDNNFTALTESHALIIGNAVEIYVPLEVADQMNEALGVRQQGYRRVVDCNAPDALPREFYLYLSSQGITTRVTLKNPDYLVRIGGYCLSPFVGIDFGPPGTIRQFWMIASTFVHHYGPDDHRTLPSGFHKKHISAAPSTSTSMQPPRPEFVELRAFTLGGKRFELEETMASVDPFILDIITPTSMARTLNSQLGARQLPESLLWIIDCDKLSDLPTFSLHFYRLGNELTRTLQPEQYILHAGGNCISPFVGIDFNDDRPGAPSWFVGDIFFGI